VAGLDKQCWFWHSFTSNGRLAQW
jgi:hypothetical protein